MKKPKVTMTIIKEDIGYGATGEVGDRFMATIGDTYEELKDMIFECVNFTFEDLGYTYTFDEINIELDLKSFLQFYKILDTKVLSKRVGIEQSILSQYLKGTKQPTLAHKRKIFKGVEKFGKELAEIEYFI